MITQQLLKVVLFILRKITYSLNMYEHNIFVFIFRSKMMIVKDEDDQDGIPSLDSLFEQKKNALINIFYLWYQSKRYPIVGIV